MRKFELLAGDAFAIGECDADALGPFGQKRVAPFGHDDTEAALSVGRCHIFSDRMVLGTRARDESLGRRPSGNTIDQTARDGAAVGQPDRKIGRQAFDLDFRLWIVGVGDGDGASELATVGKSENCDFIDRKAAVGSADGGENTGQRASLK